MGYDNRHVTELEILSELAKKAEEVLGKYVNEIMDENVKQWYVPGIQYIDNGRVELVMYDRDPIDSGETIEDEDIKPVMGDKFNDNIIGYLHNECVTNLLDPVIIYLRDNGVPVTGWVYTDTEGMESWYAFWIDGNILDKGLNEIGAARFAMSYLKEHDGVFDRKIMNRI